MGWNKMVPYDEKGNMMSYAVEGDSPQNYYRAKGGWKPAEKFSAKLTYRGCYRGRSATVFTFEDEKGHSYPMFLSGFDMVVRLMVKGVVAGVFVPVKRGSNYGLELVTQ